MGRPLLSIEAREQMLLAPYAMHGVDSLGRRHAEPLHPYRSPFQRDRDRITHSAAFRRLSSKTQVFTGEKGDYHRTRLTHTLEVASVARTIGRALALNEDLIEAQALLHDLGHPPFGHAGEDVLDECLRAEGGFNHNQHCLRIVEDLEARYPEFPGLNLTLEILEGQRGRAQRHGDLRPLLEAQVVDAADSIAYDTHDADDALELGLLTLAELLETSLWAEAAKRVRRHATALTDDELRRAVLHELLDWQVGDLLGRATDFLASHPIDSPQAARQRDTIIRASDALNEQKRDLESMLYERVYRHPRVLRHRQPAQEMLRELFDRFVARPDYLPDRFLTRVEQVGPRRSVGDYLAGMTDRFAYREFSRVFSKKALP